MDKGGWVKGRASAPLVGAVPGLRPGTCVARLFSALRAAVIFIHAVAGIGERAGDRACTGLVPPGSAGLSRPSV